jgi:hypothetical protein
MRSFTIRLKDVKQQQQALGVAVLRLEQQGTVASGSNTAPIALNATIPGAALGVNNSTDTWALCLMLITLRHNTTGNEYSFVGLNRWI